MVEHAGSSGASRGFKTFVGISASVVLIALVVLNLRPAASRVNVRSGLDSSATTSSEAAPGTIKSTAMLVNASSGLEDLQSGQVTPMQKPGNFLGYSYPIAVYAPDGGSLFYSSLSAARAVDAYKSPSGQGLNAGDVVGRPSIRVRDLQTGADTLFADGAFSMAVSATGAVAYVRASDPDYRVGSPYVGDVVVQSSPTAKPEVWSTEPGLYEVVAWAKGRLFVDHQIPGGSEAGVELLFSAPGSFSTLDGGVVALSGDGTTALMNAAAPDGESNQLRVMDVATGKAAGPPIAMGSIVTVGGASWVDDTVVVWGTTPESPALFVLSATRSDTGYAFTLKDSFALHGVTVPHDAWMASDARTVVAIADPPIRTPFGQRPEVRSRLLVQCDATNQACTYTPLPDKTNTQTGRAHNASRPLGADVASPDLAVEAR